MGKLFRRERSPFWWARWQDEDGITYRKSTRTTDRRVATLFLSAREAETIKRSAGLPVARSVRLADAVAEWLARHEPPVWSEDWWYTVDKWWKARLLDDLGGSDILVASVTKEHVAGLRVRWLQGSDECRKVAPPTVNRLCAVGASFYAWACSDDRQYALTNPFRGHVKFAENRAEPPRISEAQVAAYLAAIPNIVIRRAATVGIDAGLRISEVRRIQWGDLNEPDRFLLVVSSHARGHTKNRQPRMVPLTRRALAAILAQPRDNPRPFAALPVNVRKSHANAIETAGLATFRWHDLRHHALSRLADAGATTHELRSIAGWRTPGIEARYLHEEARRVRALVDRLDPECAPSEQHPSRKLNTGKHAPDTRR